MLGAQGHIGALAPEAPPTQHDGEEEHAVTMCMKGSLDPAGMSPSHSLLPPRCPLPLGPLSLLP